MRARVIDKVYNRKQFDSSLGYVSH